MSDLSSYVCSSDLGKPPMGDEYHPEHAVASFLSHVLAGKAANVAVMHLHVPALPHQPLCELRGNDDGAVTTSGASNGHRKIALSLKRKRVVSGESVRVRGDLWERSLK